MSDIEFYISPIANGICANVHPLSIEATALLVDGCVDKLDRCDWPTNLSVPQPTKGAYYRLDRCGEPVVRVGVFPVSPKRGKEHSSFVGLCERHKQMGMWTKPETAWGWD